jgi:hypothetical protein
VVEGAALEKQYVGNRIEGSNPSLSAKKNNLPTTGCFSYFLFAIFFSGLLISVVVGWACFAPEESLLCSSGGVLTLFFKIIAVTKVATPRTNTITPNHNQ